MVAARQPEIQPPSPAEDLRKHVIRLMQTSGQDVRSNIMVLPQVFLEFLEYDHKRALFLNKLLYWTERTKHPQGWVYKTYADWYAELGFKESVVRRLIHGDARARTRRRTLSDIGVEVTVRRAPNGSPTCHYRLNLEVFLDAVRAFLAQQQAPATPAEPVQCAGSTLCIAADGSRATPGLETAHCAERIDPEIPTQTPSEKTSPESSDDDLDIFRAYEDRFGKLKDSLQGTFSAELGRLGADRVGQVLERCASRGRSWHYVVRALANEAAPDRLAEPVAQTCWHGAAGLEEGGGYEYPPASETASVAVSERIRTPWSNSRQPGAMVQDAWATAVHQMELQFDRMTVTRCLQGLMLVDFEPETHTFVVLAPTLYAQAMLEGRLKRSVERILSDVYGLGVSTVYLLCEEWQAGRVA